MKNKETLKGGLSDNKTLIDIAKKHNKKGYYDINDIVSLLKKELEKGVKVEIEHTNDRKKAKEIAMDHLWEDPKYYSKLKKIETKEMTDASSSGSYSGALSNPTPVIKKKINSIKNSKSYKGEFKEVTDASSSGAYDVPLFGGTKGRKNPLSIGGPETIKTSRAVKDKNFPKWGGPGGVFIKIKEKCKKFPYCNQGDINAIEVMRESIENVSKKYGIPTEEIEKIVLNEIKRIFI